LTIVGGQHFTVTDVDSLKSYPEIDIVVRGEGEKDSGGACECLSGKIPLIKLMAFRFDLTVI